MLNRFSRLHILVSIFGCCLFVLSGCGSSSVVRVKDADNGGQKVMKVGRLLQVSLESNPTTGFSWEALEVDDSILQLQGEPKFYPGDDGVNEIVGAGGTDNFYFIAVGEGETNLEFVYRRSWEDVEPEKEFTINVYVR